MTYANGEEVMIVKPRGVTGISYGEWDFNTNTPIPGKIIDRSSIYLKRFGYEYCVLGLSKLGHMSQWVPASALTPISPKEDDNLSYWL